MKKWKRLNLIFVIIAVLAVGFIAINRSGALFPAKSEAGNSEKDRFFKEMGILPVPAQPVPGDIELVDLIGNRILLADYRGSIVFLNFWTTWCPPCRKEMPALEKLHRLLKYEKFVILAVSLKESAEKVDAFFKKQKLTFAAMLDPRGDAGKKLAIGQIPTTLILNKKGEIIGKALGSRHWADRTSIDLFTGLSRMD